MGSMAVVGIVALVVLGVLALCFLFWIVAIYNRLVKFRAQARNAWAQIDVQLKRRHDLIPNLVETVKGYAGHEQATLQNVIEARSKAVSAETVGQHAQAEGELSQALGRLMMVVEQYPDLKANQNFLSLQEELTSTENRIGFARQHYNDAVMTLNTRIQSFPDVLVAGPFGFREEEYFELEEPAAREAPKVSF